MAGSDVCDCGRRIEQPPTGRRRTKCLVCSPADRRDRRKMAPVTPLPGAGTEHPYVVAVRRKLGDEADSADGLGILMLAEVFAAGGGTQAGLVALHRRIDEATTALLKATAADDEAGDGVQWGVG
jgi:hypothetical protein